MHVATTRRRHGDKEYTSHLLRQTYREGGKVRHRTLANLSYLPDELIEVLRRGLRGEAVGLGSTAPVEVMSSTPHGHVAAVMGLAKALGLPDMLGPPGEQRDLALALIVARVIRPGSKAASARWWSRTTLAEDLGLQRAGPDECYEAMDWLVSRQGDIEAGLAGQHLVEGGLVYYDVSSSYLDGHHCELAARGYPRDPAGKGRYQIVYGLICDPEGRPVAIRAHRGNTADPSTLKDATDAIKDQFSLNKVVLVGDRGMITQARIEAIKALGDMDWITALRAPAIKDLVARQGFQPSLFDETNLVEIAHPDYPGERLVACRNPALGAERARKRSELLDATEADLAKVVSSIQARRLRRADKIGIRVGRILGRHKMAKHFDIDISEGALRYERKHEAISAEAALDGIYIIRTSVSSEVLSAPEVVAAYKALAQVEQAFRSLKTVDLELRPIHHRLADRVRAHLLICMLAYYLTWHLRRAWAPLTFTDEQAPTRTDPVAKAARSKSAATKASTGRTKDGLLAHSYGEILEILGELPRNVVKVADAAEVEVLTSPNTIQRRAFELLGLSIPQHCV
jgi:transposase